MKGGTSHWTDLSCQGIKLVVERHGSGTIERELALADDAH
jgi:hypothetical protein